MIIELHLTEEDEGQISVIVDNCVTSVTAALETDNNVGFLCKAYLVILPFSLIAPVAPTIALTMF